MVGIRLLIRVGSLSEGKDLLRYSRRLMYRLLLLSVLVIRSIGKPPEFSILLKECMCCRSSPHGIPRNVILRWLASVMWSDPCENLIQQESSSDSRLQTRHHPCPEERVISFFTLRNIMSISAFCRLLSLIVLTPPDGLAPIPVPESREPKG